MELSGSGSCVGYRQIHQRLRDDHGLVVDRYMVTVYHNSQVDENSHNSHNSQVRTNMGEGLSK